MPSDNPFNEKMPLEQPFEATLVDTSSDRSLWKVLVTIAFFAFFSCCGVGTLLYWGLQQTLGTNSAIQLPTRSVSTFADDSNQFNKSLETLHDPSEFPIEIRRLVDKTVAAINTEKDLSFDRKMFAQAVAASHLSGGSLGTVERITIRRSLDEYEPTPTSDIVHYRILNVRIDDGGLLGTIDLITYEEDQQAESHQWFIVKQQDVWEFYDWQRLEYGRRSSDEYAAFVHGAERLSSGFDDAMVRLSDVVSAWNVDNGDEAFRILKSCEPIPMLPEDHDEAMLHIAYMWQAFDEYEEAIRIAKRIRSPDNLWGAWPVIAASYTYLDDYDEAMTATLRAQKQSPNHPNVLILLATLHDEQEQFDESAMAAAQALTVCPEDSSLWRDVTGNSRIADIPLLLQILFDADVEYGWQRLLSEADASTEWAEAFIQQLNSQSDLPVGVRELAEGSLAWSKGDYDEAGGHYLQAKTKVTSDDLKERAKADHIAARLEVHRYAELFDESDDIDATVSYLVELAFDDDLYVNKRKLLQTLQSHSEASRSPWTVGLNAWAQYSLEDYQTAIQNFDNFLSWLKDHEDLVTEDQAWLLDTTEYYAADTLIELDRHFEVIERWPDDVVRHATAVDDLLTVPSDIAIQTFLQQTADTESESLRLQRLRLAAELAMRSADIEHCDTLHRKAIELAQSVYGNDQSYLSDDLITERAKHLVWNRIEASKVEQVAPQTTVPPVREKLIVAAVQEAASVHDDTATMQWSNEAKTHKIEEGDGYVRIQNSLAQLRVSRGNYPDAIEAFRECIKASDASVPWRYRSRQNDLLSALLSAERWDEAITLGEDMEGREDQAPVELIVAFARGDADEVNRIYKEGDELFVDGWIDDTKIQPYLLKHARQPWLVELLQQHTLTTQHKPPSDHGRLFFKQGVNIDERWLRDKLNGAMEQDFRVTAVPSADHSSGTKIWLAHSASGQRVLLSKTLQTFSSPDTNNGLADELNEATAQLSIEVIDAQPMAAQRLFQVAAALAETNAIAFSRGYDNMTWTGKDLRKQLTWVDRVPVGPDVRKMELVSKKDSESEDDMLTVDEWRKQLEDAGAPLDVILVQTTWFCRESIPAKLIEANEYDVTVTVESNSAINPLIKQGIRYNADPSFVTAANP